MELCKILGLDLDWTCDFSKYSVIRSMAMDRIYLNYMQPLDKQFFGFTYFKAFKTISDTWQVHVNESHLETVKFGIKVSVRVKLFGLSE